MENLENLKNFQTSVALCVAECVENEKLDKERLTEIVQSLDKSSFKDVVEERALIKRCGYVLCLNELKMPSKQKFRIIRNRVFDVTDRYHFCSDLCYKSHLHLEAQLPDEPLWITGSRKKFALNFVDKSNSSISHGVEIELDPTLELAKALEVLDLTENELKVDALFETKVATETKPAELKGKLFKQIEAKTEEHLEIGNESTDDSDIEDVPPESQIVGPSTINEDTSDSELDVHFDADSDALEGWRQSTKLTKNNSTAKSHEQVLSDIRNKYFIKGKVGFSKKTRAPILIDARPIPVKPQRTALVTFAPCVTKT